MLDEVRTEFALDACRRQKSVVIYINTTLTSVNFIFARVKCD
jgi:hypothetical protein